MSSEVLRRGRAERSITADIAAKARVIGLRYPALTAKATAHNMADGR
jgi:hypothetical protein